MPTEHETAVSNAMKLLTQFFEELSEEQLPLDQILIDKLMNSVNSDDFIEIFEGDIFMIINSFIVNLMFYLKHSFSRRT